MARSVRQIVDVAHASAAAPFRFDRTFTFAAPPHHLWHALDRTGEYPAWWSWLRTFDTAPGDGLAPGVVATCLVRAPLPYSLRFDVYVERVVAPHVVETYVTGDLDGPARLDVEPSGTGSRARLSWDLELRDRMLARLAPVARPAMEWAHDRIVALGVEQFRRHALSAIDSRHRDATHEQRAGSVDRLAHAPVL